MAIPEYQKKPYKEDKIRGISDANRDTIKEFLDALEIDFNNQLVSKWFSSGIQYFGLVGDGRFNIYLNEKKKGNIIEYMLFEVTDPKHMSTGAPMNIKSLENYLMKISERGSIEKAIRHIKYDRKWNNYKPIATGDTCSDERRVLIDNMNDREALFA